MSVLYVYPKATERTTPLQTLYTITTTSEAKAKAGKRRDEHKQINRLEQVKQNCENDHKYKLDMEQPKQSAGWKD